VADQIRVGMGCEGAARRQSANNPADQQRWLWSIRDGSDRAGRMAVTEHITGPSASEGCTPARGRRRVMPTRAWPPVAARLDQGGDRWIAWSLHARSPVVRSVRACVPPGGGLCAIHPQNDSHRSDAPVRLCPIEEASLDTPAPVHTDPSSSSTSRSWWSSQPASNVKTSASRGSRARRAARPAAVLDGQVRRTNYMVLRGPSHRTRPAGVTGPDCHRGPGPVPSARPHAAPPGSAHAPRPAA